MMSYRQAIENMNYWNDSRTIAGMVDKPKIEETANGNFILWETEDDDGNEVVHRLRCRWEVCETCHGDGKHVNPSIDCCGITGDEWDEWDYDDRQMYMSGGYDITCNECEGRRVMPVLDETNNDADLVERYHQYQTDCYNDARESAAERAMGA